MINYSFITDKLTKLQTEIIEQFVFHKPLLSIHEVYSAINLLEIKESIILPELRKLQKLGIVQEAFYMRGMLYILVPSFKAYYMVQLASKNEYSKGLFLNNIKTRKKELSIDEKLLCYLSSKEPLRLTFADVNDDDENILDLIIELIDYDQFNVEESAIPFAILYRYFDSRVNQVLNNLNSPEKAELVYTLMIQMKEMPPSLKKESTLLYNMLLFLFKGEPVDIPNEVGMDTGLGLRLHAAYYVLNGDIDQALVFFEKAQKSAFNAFRYVFTIDYIFSFLHAIALVASSNPKDLEKLMTIYNKKNFKTEEFLVAHLLFSVKLPKQDDAVNFVRKGMTFSVIKKLEFMLLMATASYFKIDVGFMSTHKQIYDDLLKSTPYKLIQLILSSASVDHKSLYQTLNKELGFNSPFTLVKVEEEWERVLNRLITSKVSGVSKSAASLERIVYFIEPSYLGIYPHIQKSKDGITWTKGRAIALSRLYNKTQAFMTAQDNNVADSIKKHQHYYGATDYNFNVEQTMASLIGSPHVFLKSNPSIAIEIVEKKPELQINKTKTGYKLTLNTPADTSYIRIEVENDVRINVMKLSTKQLEITQLLSRISLFPFEAEEKLMQLLNHINSEITIYSDLINKDASMKQIKGDNRAVIQLIPIGSGLKAELYIKPLTSVAPYCKPGVGGKSVVGVIEGDKCQAVRSFAKEKNNALFVEQRFQEIAPDEDILQGVLFEDPYQSLELLDALKDEKDILVEWPEGVRFKITQQADFSNLKLSLKSKNNWFEIEGELKVGKDMLMSVAELIDGVRSSQGRFIKMANGDFLALSNQLRRQLLNLEAQVAVDKKGKLKIQQFATLGLDALTEAGVNIKGDKAYTTLKSKIGKAEVATYTVPKQLQASLREYQEDGFRWLARLNGWGAGACLADDMGLGKTLQTIALLLLVAKKGPSLVVAPASVLLNWKSEIERFAPSLTVMPVNGSGVNRAELINAATAHDVILVTYGLLVTEEALLTDKVWNVIALDEGHTIKNKETKMSKSAMKLQSSFRLLLTGTPIQNHLGEIWNLYQFIIPGLLGSFEQFNERFIQPITQHGDKVQQKQLKKLISPFLLRRTKSEVLNELPPKTEIIKEVELSEVEMGYYELLRRKTELELESGTLNPVQTLSEITKLRQAACNVNLVNKDLKIKSSKIEVFLSIVNDLQENNHRALVFSQFTSHLALIRAELDELKIPYLYLDGSTPIPERAKLVKEFQTGEQPVFLISLKAGGLGLNLTAADFIIHMDPWWNPAIEDQASDRAHRIGQLRPVTVYRLVAKQTIEEKIIRMHASKKDLADSLLEGSNLSHKLTKAELLDLLRG